MVLPAPLRPTRPTLWPVGMPAVAPVEDRPALDAVGEVVDVQHGARDIAAHARPVTAGARIE